MLTMDSGIFNHGPSFLIFDHSHKCDEADTCLRGEAS